MTLHNVGYAEEMLQTRLVEKLKEKKESHEKLAHIKLEKMEKDIN